MAATLGLVAALGLAACGGSDSSDDGSTAASSSSSTDEVLALVQEQQKPPTWKTPGPAFDASKARGKTLWYVPVSNDIPLSNLLGKTMSEAGKTVGVDVTTCDGKGQVSRFASCIDQGVGQGVDAILLQSIPTALVEPQIKDAKAAGIPVIQSQESDPALPTSAEKDVGVVAKVGFSFSEAGRRMADAAIADSGGKMHAVVIQASDVPNSKDVLRGLDEQFDKYCPDCTTDIKDAPVPKWSTDVGTLVESAVKDPNVDYVIPIFDNMATFAIPAVNSAGAADRVRIVTFNATPAVMQSLADEDVVVAEIGNANVWAGWSFMDQALRVMTGTAPLEDEKIPFRTFTNDKFDGDDWKSNIGTIDVNEPESTWYGSVDPGAEYTKLWGVN